MDRDVEETKTNVQKDVEHIFSVKLKRGSYDWQIKCVDAEGNERFSEIRDLRIKKKSSSGSSPSNILDNLDYLYYSEDRVISDSENGFLEEPEVVVLNLKQPKESKGFFESLWDWFKGLFD